MRIGNIGTAAFFAFALALPALAQTAPPAEQPPAATVSHTPERAPISPFAAVLDRMNQNAQEIGSQRVIIQSMQMRIAELEKRIADAGKSQSNPQAKDDTPK
jgi:hypothetical protein